MKRADGEFEIVRGGTCTPAGFLAAGIAAGIKSSGQRDLALVVSEIDAVAAGTFTTNQVKAAPVKVSMQHIRTGVARAIIANAGNANACTGLAGIDDAKEMAGLVALMLDVPDSSVLVCSTGRIGVPMPMNKLRKGIRRTVRHLARSGAAHAARAIMTSDTVPKQSAVRFQIGGKLAHIGACAKGAGMIDPNMATMLCFLTTDVAIDRKTLHRCLVEAVDQSFNCITVDGDMSTNDSVLILANGMAGNPVLRSYHADLGVFQAALNHVTRDLARQIVMDGEGVSRLVEVAVQGAKSARDARSVAESIANSSLVKCAWAGGDPNWGRILAAIGYSSARVREELIDVYYDGLLVVQGGRRAACPERQLQKVVRKRSFQITVNLHQGEGQHTVFTTDLTEAYVRFNLGE